MPRGSKCVLTVRNGHGAGFLIAKSARSRADHGLSRQLRAELDAHCAAIVGDWEEPSGESRLRLLNARPKRLNSSFPSIFRHTQPIGPPNTLKGSVTHTAHDLVDSLSRGVMGGPFEAPGPKVINEEFDCEYE